MELYRLSKTKHIRDCSGAGSRISGGRWNQRGTAVLYAAESRSLASMEYLVHVPMAVLPKNLSIAVLEIPDSASSDTIGINDLPSDWRDYPAPPELAEIGTNWAAGNLGLLLRVPSAVVKGEYNVLINPAHPDMREVKILGVEAYAFDPRLRP